MNNNDFLIQLGMVIDQSSLSNVEKQLLKKKFKVQVETDTKQAQKEIQQLDSVMKMASQNRIDTKIAQLNDQLRKNSKYTQTAKTELKGFISELQQGNVASSRLQDITTKAKVLHSEMGKLNKIGFSFKDSIKNQLGTFTQWIGISSAVMATVNTLRKMKDATYDVDTAMTSLYKVTDETDAKYTEFLTNANANAQKLGRTVSSLIEQTASWAKLGYNINQASSLAQVSSIYANVGEVDDNTAIQDMVSALKAFNIEANDSITIVNRFNKLGNEFATDAASLGDGLSNSASALKLAGNDIDQSLAMLTGGTEIIQNASEMGNALKVLSMRLRGMKGELQDLGEEYDTVESISKIQTQILNQTNGAVNIFNDSGNFKSTYEILKGISEVWDHISQTDQAALLETIAGKQRGNQIAALIQSFQSGQVDKALEASKNSDGSAIKEQERWIRSLDAKTKIFEAAFQKLSQTTLDSDFLKGLVDSGTALVNILDTIIGQTGVITPILTGFGITKFIQNLDWLTSRATKNLA